MIVRLLSVSVWYWCAQCLFWCLVAVAESVFLGLLFGFCLMCWWVVGVGGWCVIFGGYLFGVFVVEVYGYVDELGLGCVFFCLFSR